MELLVAMDLAPLEHINGHTYTEKKYGHHMEGRRTWPARSSYYSEIGALLNHLPQILSEQHYFHNQQSHKNV